MLNPRLGIMAERWLPQFTDLAVKSAVVLTVTLAVWALMRRAPAASRHLVLLAGITVLLALPALMAFIPRQSLPSPIAQTPTTAPPPAMTFAEPPPSLPAVPEPSVFSPALLPPPSLPPSLPATPTPAPFPWAFGLLAIWLAGVLLAASRVLAAHLRVWRLIRSCPPLPEDFRESFPKVAATFCLGPAGTPPLVWGGLRPTLLLPAEALTWPQERLRAVLLHENAHLQRRDWLTQTLTQITCALYWFNPLVWLTAHQMQAEAERACDDAVLLAGVLPADYALDLLAVARSLTAARFASAGAVTMARRSPVRSRLEAILDTRCPRRSVTRRAAALSLVLALAVAVPLASLRPAARADAPNAAVSSTASSGGPPDAELTAVQQHLQGLEQERAAYTAAHPNTLSPSQIAVVDKWLQQNDFKQNRARFWAQEKAEYLRARAEAKKPHSKAEQKEIWRTIFSYERPPASVVKNDHDFNINVAQLKNQIDALPASQVTRETQMYAIDSKIALDRTRAETMEMERNLGYSLHLSEDSIINMANLGFQGEKDEHILRADIVYTFLLCEKLRQHKLIEDADIDTLIAILHKPSARGSVTHLVIMGFFHRLPDASPIQQQKIREAVMPFLTSQDKWERKSAERVIKKYGVTAPLPPSPKTPPVPTPVAALIPAPPHPIGVSPMTPLNSLKTALLKTASFVTLASSLVLPAAQAQPIKPMPVPQLKAVKATVTDAASFHWDKLVLQHTSLRIILALTHWDQGGTKPEGVKHLVFLYGDNAILVSADPSGLAQMRDTLKTLDVTPQQVQVKMVLVRVSAADLDALGVNLTPVLPDGAYRTSYIKYAEGHLAGQLLETFTQKGKVMTASTITTVNNMEARVRVGSPPPVPALSEKNSYAFVLTPRINQDKTVTIQLNMTASVTLNFTQTIGSGSTLMLGYPEPKQPGAKENYLLLFVTPTVQTDLSVS